jgi:RNA-directed DNA polymerase
MLSIPTIRDRVVQGALKLILEPIFEADFQPGSFGYRPKKSAQDAVVRVRQGILHGKTRVIDLDLRSYFDNVRHHLLLEKVAVRVDDGAIMGLLKKILKSSGSRGVPQGGVVSPLLSNIYLNEVDRMLQRAQEVTSFGEWTAMEYVRFADDIVVLVDWHPRQTWLFDAVQKRLREEFDKLQVELNEEKSRVVDLARGECFGFLGFDFRRVRTPKGRWMPLVMPQMKKRTELLRKLKGIFNRSVSQPLRGVIDQINPILRGWVNYFAIGNSSRCFSFIHLWVEKKIRRLLAKARQRQGFGWQRLSSRWLYDGLGLFREYKVQWQPARKASPAGIGPITLGTK